MVALAQAGRRLEALDVYTRVRATLIDEAGMEPGPGLRGCSRRCSPTTSSSKELELKTNTEITRAIHALTAELHRRLLPDADQPS